ncbi:MULTISPECIES: hypothetical protein [unclassified Kaistella]|uniref:hypothetical protein n=1 Tax=unclassified Kaistella TaxID=2762626 RepID=UPI0027341619|nr:MULTISPECIES: hypothetical protein [unclassified Kaistella]MCZ2084879.1 hypothetical protein [Flavobacteriales bacterium]MDP2452605.1 hypothetical protein [Kaistella sp. SH11-4b]MDP2455513.1 hypothetical protein [Kaistella sp. SH40-3]MDP2458417.1 hypothetical protein [Kaistella sp. SH19-2b]
MRKLVLSVALLAVGTFAMAQNQKMQKMDPAQMEQKRADHMKQMQAELNLSDAQVTKIKALQDRRMAERKKNAPQMQAERKAKMEQMKAKRDQNNAEMKQILTPEQYQKWETSKKGKMQKRGQMMKSKKMDRMQNAK